MKFQSLINALTIIVYKILDSLKQKSPLLWAIVQGSLWLSFVLISTNVIPTFGYKEIILIFLGSLISGVGSRTTHKLNSNTFTNSTNSTSPVTAISFKEGVNKAIDKIESDKELLKRNKTNDLTEIHINQKFLNKDQWLNETFPKNQIYLHHSVSGSVDSIISTWNQNKDRVATAFSIDKDGKVYQHFPEDEWAHHLYVNSPGNRVNNKFKKRDKILNQQSIGIELVNFGGLVIKNGKWYSVYNKEIENVYVLDKPYRGYQGFEKYTSAQIEALRLLLLRLFDKYPIIKDNLRDSYEDIFQISNDALNSKPGIYTHTSVRTDKSDCYPDKDLIEMLNSLKGSTKVTEQ